MKPNRIDKLRQAMDSAKEKFENERSVYLYEQYTKARSKFNKAVNKELETARRRPSTKLPKMEIASTEEN